MSRLPARPVTSLVVLLAVLAPIPALADKVLVLALENDTEARVRHQMEAALDLGHQVERVSLEEFQRAASQKGMAPERAGDASGLQEIAPELGITAVLAGSVDAKITVRIMDGTGAMVWSKQLPSVDGRLSPNHARRLAAAVITAATSPTAPRPPASAAATPPPVVLPGNSDSPHPQEATHAPPAPEPVRAAPRNVAVAPQAPAARPAPSPVTAQPVRPQPVAPQPVAPPPVQLSPPPSAVVSAPAAPPPDATETTILTGPPPPRTSLQQSPPTYDYPIDYPARGSSSYYAGYAPPRADTTASPPPRAPPARAGKPKAKKAGGERVVPPHYAPRYFRVELGALGVLRSYCARPGVTQGCVQYDSLSPADRPAGPTADFSYQNIYPGGMVSAELFPLAGMDEVLLRGIGLLGGYGRAWSTSNQPGTTPTGTATLTPVSAIDERYQLMLAARYYFGWDSGGPVTGFVGLRFGFVGRSFLPQSPAGVFLPATRRQMWAIGIDVQLPFIWWMKLELGAQYYLGNGVSVEDAAVLGSQDASIGFSAWGGLSGDFALGSPFGYFVRAQWDRFDERFGAGGSAWPNGGSSQETYVTLSAGVSLAF